MACHRGACLPISRASLVASCECSATPPPRMIAGAACQPPGGLEGRSQGPAQHPDQRSMAHLLPLDGRRCARSGNRGLSLKHARTTMKKLPNIHPGEVLLEEFLLPLGISQNALARAAKVPPRRINEIVLGKRGVTADTAIRLARALGTSERFWLGLQADYDLEEARRTLGKDGGHIQRIAA